MKRSSKFKVEPELSATELARCAEKEGHLRTIEESYEAFNGDISMNGPSIIGPYISAKEPRTIKKAFKDLTDNTKLVIHTLIRRPIVKDPDHFSLGSSHYTFFSHCSTRSENYSDLELCPMPRSCKVEQTFGEYVPDDVDHVTDDMFHDQDTYDNISFYAYTEEPIKYCDPTPSFPLHPEPYVFKRLPLLPTARLRARITRIMERLKRAPQKPHLVYGSYDGPSVDMLQEIEYPLNLNGAKGGLPLRYNLWKSKHIQAPAVCPHSRVPSITLRYGTNGSHANKNVFVFCVRCLLTPTVRGAYVGEY